jgi:hypothetical protein
MTAPLSGRGRGAPAGVVARWQPPRVRSNRFGGVDMYTIRADGAGNDELVLSSPEKFGLLPTDRLLLYHSVRHGQWDLWVIPASRAAKAEPFLETPANAPGSVFPGRAMGCLHVRRVGHRGGLRSPIPRWRRQVARVDAWRRASTMETRWSAAVSSVVRNLAPATNAPSTRRVPARAIARVPRRALASACRTPNPRADGLSA